ncbi:transcription antitermination factor NusB [Corynebacterium uberis]|uniref:transcription antitermination factor NusB n=1 Tax=Corynebacterium TaxID=1716 RepID=UPI001D09C823|nr:transcription antitermination factor NusB [Corynebacterium uberis]MCZ9308573.1 transcription antitermination factor NusB [Corynebacterium sp. c6VSa_13]UDL74223.1 transcription antitermination factor NusB [Corynebacterium uberis]UDL74897.1 transcription antitermination factor NusB [Corynebacterium uberis]UDL77111.1 transcription antitermination factor NusB [Corynebacterium uberis]UDL79394.1 transcription antitermination factor NusB [Corynebacterium uberis]
MAEKGHKRRRHGARYKARRRAVDILFEAEARDIDPVSIVEDRVELSRNPENQVAPVSDYTTTIVHGAARELDAIDDAIEAHLTAEWRLDRLPAVDRAILRVAVWELLFNPEVPTATALVEAVELASAYSTDKASPYIHATLDGIGQQRPTPAPTPEASGDSEADADDQPAFAASQAPGAAEAEPAQGSVEEPEEQAEPLED